MAEGGNQSALLVLTLLPSLTLDPLDPHLLQFHFFFLQQAGCLQLGQVGMARDCVTASLRFYVVNVPVIFVLPVIHFLPQRRVSKWWLIGHLARALML